MDLEKWYQCSFSIKIYLVIQFLSYPSNVKNQQLNYTLRPIRSQKFLHRDDCTNEIQ